MNNKLAIEKVRTFGSMEIEKERLQLARDTNDSRIMLADASLLDEQGNT